MHRALIVGISDYGRLKQSLPGCINDMNGWRDIVSAWGIGSDETRLLSNSQATKDAILEGITWLLSDAGVGDERFFFYAGHGARLRRRDPKTGEPQDTVDETLVPYPGEHDDLETIMIFDDDLAALVDASGFPKKARLTFILDSCHSGGMLRDILDQVHEAPLPRCLSLPQEIVDQTFDKPRGLRSLDKLRGFRSFGALDRSAQNVPRLIIAAALAEQSAWDAQMPDGKRHGVFSYHAQDELTKNGSLTPREIVDLVVPRVGRLFPQTPTILGSETRFDEPLGVTAKH